MPTNTALNEDVNSVLIVAKDSNDFLFIGVGLGFKKWPTPHF